MVSPKRFVVSIISLIALMWGILPQVAFASKSDYYDFGPYYNQPQVLGFSFSSLENLPVPKIPDSLVLQKATGFTSGSFFYPFDRIAENVQLTFTFDPSKKEELRLDIAQERLVEAKTLQDAGKTEAATQAFNDYNQTLQDVSRKIVNADRVEEVVSAQAVITQSMALNSSPVWAEEWNSVTNMARKALDGAAETRGDPAIPEDLSADIQKLKEEGLISEEESNKLYSLKSRGEVREELDKLSTSGQFPASELIKLDTAIAKNYPDVQKEMAANFQVAELRTYQTRPQPSEAVLAEIRKWQDGSSVPPPNDIKPYLWYNRAQDLAGQVDLTNFSPDQQQDVGKLYPKAVSDNPTYVPLPSPSPSPSPSPVADASPTPTPTPAPTNPYLSGTGGALPGQPTYFLKRWGENLATTFTFDPAEKARLKLEQAERRLSEAEAISSDDKKSAEYQDTIKSYAQAMVDATSIATKDMAGRLENAAARHEAMLEKGLLPAPKDPKLITAAIKATEDALDKSADVLGRPALPSALADRLDDLKAQGLILPEEANDLVGSSSRKEVREKIRKLIELGSFPLADAKKMDEAQMLTTPSDYNQLVEVKKVEELQNLRAVQSEFAQTPALKAQAANLDQKKTALVNSIDLSGIKQEDLGGRQDLIQAYQQLTATASARPVNSGQFEGLPENEIGDYEKYKCEGYGQYYSFAVEKCVAYEPGQGFRDDAHPVCPVGYNWSWETQSCQTAGIKNPYSGQKPSTGSCPEGSTFKNSEGCAWDKNGKSVYDAGQYRCSGRQYYSFEQKKCVDAPKAGESYPKDAAPNCKEDGSYWSWSEGKCLKTEEPSTQEARDISIPKPVFVTPDNPFYFLKTAGEAVRLAVSFSPEAKQQTRIAQARERLAEGYSALEKGNKEDFKEALSAYTAKMQDIYNDASKSSWSEKARKTIGEKLAEEVVDQNLILQKIEVVATSDQAAALSAASSSIILGADKAADLSEEPPLPDDLKTKIKDLPVEMISEEDKKKLLEVDSRVEARMKLGELASKGGVTAADMAFLNDDFNNADLGAKIKIGELRKLEEIVSTLDQKEKTLERVEKNEGIAGKLNEFQKNFEPGKEIPSDIRPYVRLGRINEVAQTIRPDIVNLEEFQNRKDLVLAVATLQEEFRPTQQARDRVEAYRRSNPGAALPPELARVEALSFSLGVRNQAGPCFLPTPPFSPNTPCPPPGAAIPITSYLKFTTLYSPVDSGSGGPYGSVTPSTDKDGKPLVYGQGPKAESAGVCPGGFHWMYDNGGWCMSNGGSYGSSNAGGVYTPSGPQTSGYTPYSPYYTAPGAPPYGTPYQGGGGYSYSAPSYYGSAPTNYTTNPPSGTVPGSGPAPISPGKCPSGFHWMSDSGGWCMADGGTYAPSGSYPGGNNNYYSPNLTQSSCGPGYYWDGRGCIRTSPTDTPSSSYQSGCTPGYYWNGSKCVAGGYEGSGWSDSAARSQSWCQPPSNGCGSNSYWDYGSCYCRSSSTYSGGSGPSPSNQCQGLSCGGGAWLDYSTCSCKYSGGSGTTPTGSPITCYPPSAGCPGGWYDYGTCSCKSSGSTTSSGSSGGCANVSASSCGAGWYFDSSACTCRQSSTSGGGSTTPTSGGGSSGGSCPSGYHWMDNSWCMSDSAAPQSGPSTASTPTSTTTTTSSEPAPQPSSTTTTTSEPAPAAPPPSSEPAPAPSP
ncbi:hypothetical protein HY385_01185 [Candidatus Daviesbacteria bacterium]|nr:hypothetical protein [Candidatus Daviesbacteria bacterium]